MGAVFGDKNTQVLHNLTYAAKTDVGKKRSENQDNYVVVTGEGFRFFCVADGMGGARSGGLASQIAVDCLREGLKQKYISRYDLSTAVEQANQKIYRLSQESPENNGMGTTLVGLCFTGLEFYIVNVGDSRAYRLRNSKLDQLTVDHSLVQELIKAGAIKGENKDTNPISHMLTRSLGPAQQVEVDCIIASKTVCRGDIYLVCSDGLYNMVSEETMKQILASHDLEVAVEMLVDEANRCGGSDNITVILVKAGDEFPEFDPEQEEREKNQTHPTDTIEFDSAKLSEIFHWQKSRYLESVFTKTRLIIFITLLSLLLVALIMQRFAARAPLQDMPQIVIDVEESENFASISHEAVVEIPQQISWFTKDPSLPSNMQLDFDSSPRWRQQEIIVWGKFDDLLAKKNLIDISVLTQENIEWSRELSEAELGYLQKITDRLDSFSTFLKQYHFADFDEVLRAAAEQAKSDSKLAESLKEFQEVSWRYLANKDSSNLESINESLKDLRSLAATQVRDALHYNLNLQLLKINVEVSEYANKIALVRSHKNSNRELTNLITKLIAADEVQLEELKQLSSNKLEQLSRH